MHSTTLTSLCKATLLHTLRTGRIGGNSPILGPPLQAVFQYSLLVSRYPRTWCSSQPQQHNTGASLPGPQPPPPPTPRAHLICSAHLGCVNESRLPKCLDDCLRRRTRAKHVSSNNAELWQAGAPDCAQVTGLRSTTPATPTSVPSLARPRKEPFTMRVLLLPHLNNYVNRSTSCAAVSQTLKPPPPHRGVALAVLHACAPCTRGGSPPACTPGHSPSSRCGRPMPMRPDQ